MTGVQTCALPIYGKAKAAQCLSQKTCLPNHSRLAAAACTVNGIFSRYNFELTENTSVGLFVDEVFSVFGKDFFDWIRFILKEEET